MQTKKQTTTIDTSMSVDEVVKTLEKAIKNGKVVCTGVTGQPGTLQVLTKKTN